MTHTRSRTIASAGATECNGSTCSPGLYGNTGRAYYLPVRSSSHHACTAKLAQTMESTHKIACTHSQIRTRTHTHTHTNTSIIKYSNWHSHAHQLEYMSMQLHLRIHTRAGAMQERVLIRWRHAGSTKLSDALCFQCPARSFSTAEGLGERRGQAKRKVPNSELISD
jgi:hypothetical protein